MTQVAQQVVPERGEGRTFRAGGRGDRTRARARQAAKRRTFPLINSQIIAVADTGDLELIMSTIEAYLPQMNLVNLSTALHRLAKLTSGDPEALAVLHEHPTLNALVETVRAALERAGSGGAPPQCQALSNITWSLATVQVVDGPSLARTAELTTAYMMDFKPFELASLLWAFAKLGDFDPVAREAAGDLFVVSAAYVGERLDQFTFRCQVMLSWAFAAAGQHDPALFRGLAAQMVPSMHTASIHELATLAWAFGKTGVRQDKLFSELAQKAVPRLCDLKPQELVDMLSSFARHGFFHKGFLEGAAYAAQMLDLSGQQLAAVLSACSKLRPRHHVTRTAMLNLLPRCAPPGTSVHMEEAATLATAVAKSFVAGTGGDTVPEEGLGNGPEGIAPPQIGVFFAALAASVSAAPQQLEAVPEASLAALAAVLVAAGAASPAAGAALAREAGRRVQSLGPSVLLVLLRTLASAPEGVAVDAPGVARLLATELASRAASDQLQPHEVQAARRIISSLASEHDGTMLVVASTPDDIASCFKAYVAAEPPPAAAALTTDLELCFELLEQVADDAVGSLRGVAVPLTSMRSRAGGHLPSRPLPAGPLAAGLVCSVKNTFLHIDGDGEGPEEQDPVLVKPLPPSLDFIPPEVSPEKLEAYRLDYQKFRAGSALGAKGEVSSRVA